jgi:cytochrome bd-type quinol oxidase subunit 2
MKFVRKAPWLAAVIFVLGAVAAPAAGAVTGDKKQPSSDAPWLIGILVLVVLGAAAAMLLLRRRVSKTSGTDFKR